MIPPKSLFKHNYLTVLYILCWGLIVNVCVTFIFFNTTKHRKRKVNAFVMRVTKIKIKKTQLYINLNVIVPS